MSFLLEEEVVPGLIGTALAPDRYLNCHRREYLVSKSCSGIRNAD
jgi:hypothetical protein